MSSSPHKLGFSPLRPLLRIACGVVAIGFVVAGCAGVAAMREGDRIEAEGNIQPQNYRTEILALMRNYLNDPTQVRGAFLSEPTIREFGNNKRYASCLRYNARNVSAQYAGSKDIIITYWQGRVDRVMENPRDQCKDAAYVAFPEMERLTR